MRNRNTEPSLASPWLFRNPMMASQRAQAPSDAISL
jgi:hypothetical protein